MDASLNLATYTSVVTPRQIEVYKVNSAWNSSTITWNNKPAYNTVKTEEYQMASGSRFVNADGLVGEIGEELTTNMFIYALNNPVSMIDLSGNFAIEILLGIAGVAVVILTFIIIQSTVNLVINVIEDSYDTWKLLRQINQAKSDKSTHSKEKEIEKAGKPGSNIWNKNKKNKRRKRNKC